MDNLPEPIRPVIAALGDLLDDGLIAVNRQGLVLYANQAATSFFGERILNQPVQNFLRHPDIMNALAAALQDKLTQHLTHRLMGAIPHEYNISMQAITADLVILHVANKTGQQTLAKILTGFVADASHELRSPLTSLLGFIETMQTMLAEKKDKLGDKADSQADNNASDRVDDKAGDTADADADADADEIAAMAEFLDIMGAEAGRMKRLIDDLLSLSRVEARSHEKPQTVIDMLAIIRKVSAGLAVKGQERGVTIQIISADDMPPELPICGDADEIVMVFVNLLENAIKYCFENSVIRVIVGVTDKDMVRAQVVNQGEGIDGVHIPRLTERFYRVDAGRARSMGSTGLGLAIVKHIVNRHQGYMQITSERGAQTIFSVFFPRADRQAQMPKSPLAS